VKVLRAPDERFADLEGWPFEPRYRTVVADDGTELRFDFVDEGPGGANPILLLHGNPSWSYLHRHMIAGLVGLGHRVIALDLMGMGRSDKPADKADYTLARHVDWTGQWLEAEDLTDITLYCQDWGGLIGLNVLRSHSDRFAGVVASNTGLPVGEGSSKFIDDWLVFSQSVDELPISALVDSGTSRSLDDAEKAAYDAPFPDGSYQASAKRFPLLIPVQPDNPGVPMCRETWDFLETWTKPFLTVFGDRDPIAFKPGAHLQFQKRVPGAKDQPHTVIEGANHFIQEDAPDELVRILDGFATEQA
jgi:haloalkane dehalogenase